MSCSAGWGKSRTSDFVTATLLLDADLDFPPDGRRWRWQILDLDQSGRKAVVFDLHAFDARKYPGDIVVIDDLEHN